MKIFLLSLFFVGSAITSLASVSFSETYQESVATYKFEGEVTREILPGGSFTLRAVVPLTADDMSIVLSRESNLKITIGGWSYEGVLGDDPKFVSGKSRSARIRLIAGEKTPAGFISIAVSPRAVTLSVSAKTGTNRNGDAFQISPLAESLATEETAKIKAADNVKMEFSSELAEGSAGADLPITGATRYSTKNFGSGENAEIFDLRSVVISGKGRIQR